MKALAIAILISAVRLAIGAMIEREDARGVARAGTLIDGTAVRPDGRIAGVIKHEDATQQKLLPLALGEKQ